MEAMSKLYVYNPFFLQKKKKSKKPFKRKRGEEYKGLNPTVLLLCNYLNVILFNPFHVLQSFFSVSLPIFGGIKFDPVPNPPVTHVFQGWAPPPSCPMNLNKSFLWYMEMDQFHIKEKNVALLPFRIYKNFKLFRYAKKYIRSNYFYSNISSEG